MKCGSYVKNNDCGDVRNFGVVFGKFNVNSFGNYLVNFPQKFVVIIGADGTLMKKSLAFYGARKFAE